MELNQLSRDTPSVSHERRRKPYSPSISSTTTRQVLPPASSYNNNNNSSSSNHNQQYVNTSNNQVKQLIQRDTTNQRDTINTHTSSKISTTTTNIISNTKSHQNAIGSILSSSEQRLVVRLERCPAIDKMDTSTTTRDIERDKQQEYTDAINHCIDLLRANNYITDINSDVITRKAAVIGQEMYECLKKFRDKSKTFLTTTTTALTTGTSKTTFNDKNERIPIVDINEREHLVRNHVANPINQIHLIKEEPPEIIETEETESYEEEDGEKKITVRDVKTLEDSDEFDMRRTDSLSGEDETFDSSNNNHRSPRFSRGRKRRRPYARIPIEEKIRVVNLARSNPNWTLAWLKERSGSARLSSIMQLRQWEKQVIKKGTILDKLNVINGWVYSKYLDDKEKNYDVTNTMLREWAIEAAQKFVYPRFKFEANDAWLAGFKKIHGLKHGDIYED